MLSDFENTVMNDFLNSRPRNIQEKSSNYSNRTLPLIPEADEFTIEVIEGTPEICMHKFIKMRDANTLFAKQPGGRRNSRGTFSSNPEIKSDSNSTSTILVEDHNCNCSRSDKWAARLGATPLAPLDLTYVEQHGSPRTPRGSCHISTPTAAPLIGATTSIVHPSTNCKTNSKTSPLKSSTATAKLSKSSQQSSRSASIGDLQSTSGPRISTPTHQIEMPVNTGSPRASTKTNTSNQCATPRAVKAPNEGPTLRPAHSTHQAYQQTQWQDHPSVPCVHHTEARAPRPVHDNSGERSGLRSLPYHIPQVSYSDNYVGLIPKTHVDSYKHNYEVPSPPNRSHEPPQPSYSPNYVPPPTYNLSHEPPQPSYNPNHVPPPSYHPSYVTSQPYNPNHVPPKPSYQPNYIPPQHHYNTHHNPPPPSYNPNYVPPKPSYNPRQVSSQPSYNPNFVPPPPSYNHNYIAPKPQYIPNSVSTPYNPTHAPAPPPYNPTYVPHQNINSPPPSYNQNYLPPHHSYSRSHSRHETPPPCYEPEPKTEVFSHYITSSGPPCFDDSSTAMSGSHHRHASSSGIHRLSAEDVRQTTERELNWIGIGSVMPQADTGSDHNELNTDEPVLIEFDAKLHKNQNLTDISEVEKPLKPKTNNGSN